MGTGFCGGQHAAIQGVGRLGGAGALACVVGVCDVPLLPVLSSAAPQKAAARVAAQPALAVKEVVRFPGSVGLPTDAFEYRTGPPVDLFEYRWRRALLQVCVVLACPFFWP